MQSANELLCVLHLCIQALHLLNQLHKGLSLLDILCLDLQARPRIMVSLNRLVWSSHRRYALQQHYMLHEVANVFCVMETSQAGQRRWSTFTKLQA